METNRTRVIYVGRRLIGVKIVKGFVPENKPDAEPSLFGGIRGSLSIGGIYEGGTLQNGKLTKMSSKPKRTGEHFENSVCEAAPFLVREWESLDGQAEGFRRSREKELKFKNEKDLARITRALSFWTRHLDFIQARHFVEYIVSEAQKCASCKAREMQVSFPPGFFDKYDAKIKKGVKK